ncbi:MAG: substrate-binding domain-containing protein [Acidimicrobiales bacterium]
MLLDVANNPHETLVACGATLEAKQLGVNVTVQAPASFDPTLQIPMVEAVAATKPNGLILVPANATALFPAAQQVVSGGTKLALADATLANASIAVTQVLTNNVAGGAQAADALATEMNRKGTVLMLGVSPGEETTQSRVQGFTNEMKKYPGITLLPEQFAAASATQAASITSATLAAHPHLGGIFGTQSGAVVGAANALQAAHKNGVVRFVGVSGPPSLVQQGVVTEMLLTQAKQLGSLAMKYLVDSLRGKSVLHMTQLPLVAVTPQNLNTSSVANLHSTAGC